VPRRIEVPSADALFGRPAPSPRAAATTPPVISEAAGDAVDVRTLPTRERGARRARAAVARADQGTLRRLDELEAALGELPLDRLIEMREELETLLAAGTVDATGLERLLGLGAS
jgi:hypothetical protein